MSDIVERLRDEARSQENSVDMGSWYTAELTAEAADEIERLRAENKRLRDELEDERTTGEAYQVHEALKRELESPDANPSLDDATLEWQEWGEWGES